MPARKKPAAKKAAKKRVYGVISEELRAVRSANMIKAKKQRAADQADKMERALRLYLQGQTQGRAALAAGMGSSLNSAGNIFGQLLQRPEWVARRAEIVEEIASDDYLTLHTVRTVRKEIACNREVFPQVRLKALADEAAMMGWNKQDEDANSPVQVHIHIGTPVEPGFPQS